MVSAFLEEMKFQGVNVAVTDEMRVTVAGWAVRMALNAIVGLHLFKHIELIKIYDAVSVDEEARGRVQSGHFYCHIQLAWKAIQSDIKTLADRSLIIHEFAHALDLIDREMDGDASLLMIDESGRKEWDDNFKSVFCANYILGRSSVKKVRKVWDYFGLGRWRKFNPSDMNCVKVSELFAVSSERFFMSPHSLNQICPEIYQLLALLYRQDTLRTVPKNSSRNPLQSAMYRIDQLYNWLMQN
jgi:Mlc titration factor MtfA (ptsG expression regulator)